MGVSSVEDEQTSASEWIVTFLASARKSRVGARGRLVPTDFRLPDEARERPAEVETCRLSRRPGLGNGRLIFGLPRLPPVGPPPADVDAA
jgi:hypothetical protein